jgi:hypothetical protein
MTKKILLLGAMLLAVIAFRGELMARITGTQPTSADIACWGPDGAEVCVDASGNVVPTTDNDTTLGSSTLRWATVNALDLAAADDLTVTDDATISDDLTVTGDSFKTMASTVTVLSQDTISVAGACGGILRLTVTTDIVSNTVNTFTAPGSANAGCMIVVINSGGSGVITLDDNALFDTGLGYPSSGSIALGTSDSIMIGSLGTRWFAIGTVSDN